MELALTLVVPFEANHGAWGSSLRPLFEALAGVGATVNDSDTLGPGVMDIILEADDAATVRRAVERELADLPGNLGLEEVESGRRSLMFDWCLQPVVHRRKRLLVADMDSTIINVECLDELADFAGLKPHIAAITERAMRGELEFETALRERVALLRGLSTSALQQAYDERVRLNPGARTLIRTMAANAARCVLVSGGFTFFTRRVAEAAGFHDDRANTLIEDGDKLAGLVGEPILGREAKLRALLEEADALNLPLSETLAIGDGANDLAMIEAAGLGVAYRAKPIVAAQADAKVDHADLTALLYFQGYRAEEFVID